MKSNNKRYTLDGFIMPTALIFTIMSFWIVYGYLLWLDQKINELDYKIAVTKATYNAESGIAEFIEPFLRSSSFVKDTLYSPDQYEGPGQLNPKLNSKINFSTHNDVSMGSYDINSTNFGYDEESQDSIRQNFVYNQAQGTGRGYVRGVAYYGPLNDDGTCCKGKVTRILNHGVEYTGWGQYMYFTASEKAGGAPFSHDGVGQRRDVKFWYQDIINGVIQTNGDLVFSDFSSGNPACPDFSDATWYFTPGHTGPEDWGNCSAGSGYSTQYEALFRADTEEDVDTLTTCKYLYPPNMSRTYNEAQYVIPADFMLHRSNGTGLKDTLIMTEIEFLPNGAAEINQWWYLMPPHLKKYKGNQSTDNNSDQTEITDTDMNNPKPHHVDGFDELYESLPGLGDWEEYDYWDDKADGFPVLDQICDVNFSPGGNVLDVDLRTCKHYLDSLRAYHARYVHTSSLIESDMEPSAVGRHGIAGQHFDFHNGINQDGSGALNPDLLVYQEYISYTQPAVIYIKGGPVRVKGTFQGQWTVLTDPETTYYRHALNDSIWSNAVPDTISNNIYIVDDLVNVDANAYGSMASAQPDENCNGGSNNIMGLLSGANIVVASTRQNGLGNGCNNTNPTIFNCNSNISSVKINAALMALDESFVVQYWQNTTGDPVNSGQYAPSYLLGSQANYYNYDFQWWDEDDDFIRRTDMPPWADTRGDIKQNTAGNNDYRGVIVLWGGVVQKYRGYVYRNPTGSYDNASVGYPSKDYNYDNNILCHEPPGWPPLQCEDDQNEVNVKVIGTGN